MDTGTGDRGPGGFGSSKDRPSSSIPGFNERLTAWIPGLIEHGCSVGTRGGFLERLRSDTYLAHVLEHVTIELYGLAGVDIYYGRACATDQDGVYRITFKYEEETLGRACLAAACDLCLASAQDRPFDLEAVTASLRNIARTHVLAPSVLAIIEAARRGNIPHRRLGDRRLVLFGHGVRQRRRGCSPPALSVPAPSLPIVTIQMPAIGWPQRQLKCLLELHARDRQIHRGLTDVYAALALWRATLGTCGESPRRQPPLGGVHPSRNPFEGCGSRTRTDQTLPRLRRRHGSCLEHVALGVASGAPVAWSPRKLTLSLPHKSGRRPRQSSLRDSGTRCFSIKPLAHGSRPALSC